MVRRREQTVQRREHMVQRRNKWCREEKKWCREEKKWCREENKWCGEETKCCGEEKVYFGATVHLAMSNIRQALVGPHSTRGPHPDNECIRKYPVNNLAILGEIDRETDIECVMCDQNYIWTYEVAGVTVTMMGLLL